MQPRFDGVDTDHLAWFLSKLDGRLNMRGDELDYRNIADLRARAHLRFCVGFDIVEVQGDLLGAARCLRFKEDIHFLRVPAERFRSRRVDPLELGCASGDRLLSHQIAERYAIPLSTVVAGMASGDLMSEVRTVTRMFDGPAKDAIDIAGLGAIAYSSALSAAVRGFDDEAVLARDLFAEACRSSELGASEAGPLGRYKRLFAGIDAILRSDGPALVAAVQGLLDDHMAGLRANLKDEEWLKPPSTAALLRPVGRGPRLVVPAPVWLARATRARRGGRRFAELLDVPEYIPPAEASAAVQAAIADAMNEANAAAEMLASAAAGQPVGDDEAT